MLPSEGASGDGGTSGAVASHLFPASRRKPPRSPRLVAVCVCVRCRECTRPPARHGGQTRIVQNAHDPFRTCENRCGVKTWRGPAPWQPGLTILRHCRAANHRRLSSLISMKTAAPPLSRIFTASSASLTPGGSAHHSWQVHRSEAQKRMMYVCVCVCVRALYLYRVKVVAVVVG